MCNFYYFVIVITTFSSVLLSENDEDEDRKKSLVLISDGVNLRLPLCVNYDSKRKLNVYYRLDDDTEYFFCPQENPYLTSEYENCLFPYEKKVLQDTCRKRVEPIFLEKKYQISQPDCPSDRGRIYFFAFQPCRWITKLQNRLRVTEPIKDPLQIVYTICYDHDKERVSRVSHAIYSPKLWTNIYLEKDRQLSLQYELSTGYVNSDTWNKRFEELALLYSQKLKESSDLIIQFIVPPENIVFSVWKRAVYHYINTKLILVRTSKILNHVNLYIRNLSYKFLGEIKITDGFEYSDSKDMNIWWKIIFSAGGNSAIAIVIHNTIEQPSNEDKLCSQNVCDRYGWKDLIPENVKSYAYCCRLKNIARKIQYELKENLQTLNLNNMWKKVFKSTHHRRSFYCAIRL